MPLGRSVFSHSNEESKITSQGWDIMIYLFMLSYIVELNVMITRFVVVVVVVVSRQGFSVALEPILELTV